MMVSEVQFDSLTPGDKVKGQSHEGEIEAVQKTKRGQIINIRFSDGKIVVKKKEEFSDVEYLGEGSHRWKAAFGLKETMILYALCRKVVTGHPDGPRGLFGSEEKSIIYELEIFFKKTFKNRDPIPLINKFADSLVVPQKQFVERFPETNFRDLIHQLKR